MKRKQVKVYAFLFTFENLNVCLKPCLEQLDEALEKNNIDFLFICEGPFSQNYPVTSPDGTLDYLRQHYKDNNRVKIISSKIGNHYINNYGSSKETLLNSMAKIIDDRENSFILQLHDDMFFAKAFWHRLKTICVKMSKNDIMLYNAFEKTFCINRKMFYYSMTENLLVHWVKDTKFAHHGKLVFTSDGYGVPGDRQQLDTTHMCRHYAYVKPLERLLCVNNLYNDSHLVEKTDWFYEIFMNIDLNNIEDSHKNYNKLVKKGRGIYYNEQLDMTAPLQREKGAIPKVVRNTFLSNISDCRKKQDMDFYYETSPCLLLDYEYQKERYYSTKKKKEYVKWI